MKKVLIADDAAFMRLSLKLMLEKNGYEVLAEAENGKIAVEKYAQFKPDIVTMDLTMPDMDGIQAIRKIKELDKNATIIVISAMGQEPYVKEAIISGAKGFIVKPFKEDHVIKTLSNL